MKRLLASLGLALLVGAASPADPVKVTGDRFVIDETKKEAVFNGNVVLERRNMTMWANQVVATYGNSPSDISSFVATGKVKIVTPQQTATGDKAVYDPRTRLLRLTGNVLVTSKMGTVGSPDLVLNLNTNEATFSGGKGGRVSGVFNP